MNEIIDDFYIPTFIIISLLIIYYLLFVFCYKPMLKIFSRVTSDVDSNENISFTEFAFHCGLITFGLCIIAIFIGCVIYCWYYFFGIISLILILLFEKNLKYLNYIKLLLLVLLILVLISTYEYRNFFING